MIVQDILKTGWALLLVATVAAGCRTYGGYGSEEAILQQIEEANQRFAEELARAKAGLATLERMVGERPGLAALAERYRAVVQAHEAMLAYHRRLAADVADDRDRYRVLSRTLGAILSEQRIIWDRYDELLASAERTLDTTATTAGLNEPGESHYYIAPPYYQRIIHALQRPSTGPVSGRLDVPGEGQPAQPDARPGMQPSASGQPPETRGTEGPLGGGQEQGTSGEGQVP